MSCRNRNTRETLAAALQGESKAIRPFAIVGASQVCKMRMFAFTYLSRSSMLEDKDGR